MEKFKEIDLKLYVHVRTQGWPISKHATLSHDWFTAGPPFATLGNITS